VVLILVYHFDPFFSGHLAVETFITISGFILAYRYFPALNRSSVNAYRFLRNRIARLYPLHIAALAFYAVVLFSLGGQAVPDNDHSELSFLTNLLLLHNVGFQPQSSNWNFPSWTVSTEIWVNAFFIVSLPAIATRFRITAVALCCYLILFLQIGTLNAFHQNIGPWINTGLVRTLGAFCVGVLLYSLHQTWRNNLRVKRIAQLGELPLVVCTVIGVMAVPPGRLEFLFLPILFSTIFVLTLEQGAVSFVLRHRLLRTTGILSYSLYLFHIPVLLLARHAGELIDLSQPWMFAIYVCLTVAISIPMHLLIEKPFRLWFRKEAPA